MTRRDHDGEACMEAASLRADQDVIAAWVVSQCNLTAPLTSQQITGGWSNITTLLTDAEGRRVVVRRPPAGRHRGGAHDVLREARIMAALDASDVPVPTVISSCDDDSVFPSPFYVMDHVDGVVVDSLSVMADLPTEDRARLGLDLIDLLASVQQVDIDAVGLGEMRRSTPYLSRQVRRWTSQWSSNATRDLPSMDRLTARLERALNTLPETTECLVHGDFRFGNVMIRRGPAPRIAALLDWELATTGHPLADLGFIGARMSAPASVLKDDADPSSADGCPDFDQLATRFADVTERSVQELPIFVALSAWRWAIIVEGIHRRVRDGAMGAVNEDAEWHRSRVELLVELGLDWIR